VARQLTDGGFSHEILLAHYELERSHLKAEVKAHLARSALTAYPTIPLLYLHLAENLSEMDLSEEATDACRKGLALDPEPDVRSRLLVELAMPLEESTERIALLKEARLLGGNLIAAAMATIALRYSPKPNRL
jgi:tetratricopeptide (TPR) repeat protein